MKIDFTGKTALVTGSTQGIGFATAKLLQESGATVIVNGRSEEKTQQAVQRLGGNTRGIAADLGSSEGCQALVEAAGDVDILVNNAGIFGMKDFFETDDEVWDEYWQVNVMSAVRLSRAFAPAMMKKGWGRIVILASESAFNIPYDMIHYGVTKTADVSFARGLAKRLAGTGVTVNSILPGPTMSDGVENMLSGPAKESGKSINEVAADFVMQARPSSIIQRMASVEEVANMIVYVCSDLSSATTGASLRVDGGVMDTL
ncbi:3-oxoacyl-[acyl-carrier-protein] reductase FabG [Marinomonas spartinae]|uniref:3-oxoacyl-[acyl-carrier-protein] reductase FabG n=2 Tax=Marinomonas spartinae TaxID=1792290 RepID=A0A1A8T1T7_9GAMM|nr:3-oxoacyl-[acyl-carrier-protein] reductase FabG [Marinomonas spartinae]